MSKNNCTVIDLNTMKSNDTILEFSKSSVKEIIIDLDSVVFDFGGMLEKVVRQEYPNFSMERVVTYDFNRYVDKIPVSILSTRYCKEDITNYVKDFDNFHLLQANRRFIMSHMSNPVLYTDAEPYNCIDELKQLMDSPDFEVIFNTAVPHENKEIIVQGKADRLKKLFGEHNYSMVYSVGIEKPIWESAYAIIDDKLEYICLQAKANSSAKLFLIDQPYNKFEFNAYFSDYRNNTKRCKSLKDVVNELLHEIV